MVDYKTIVSTTADKTTLLHWLKSLVAEFGQAKIADIAFSNDGNSTLTFTFTLEDGTKKTATCAAITLTSDEKKLITEMQKTVTASDDGVTFNQAVTFAGNVVFKGNEIHNGYASFLGDESHAGSELHKGESTFTDLKADSLTATDGQDLLSYDGTNTSLKGKGTRPLYNDGEMALLSDIGGVSMSAFLSSIGKRRYAGKPYCFQSWDSYSIDDGLAKYLTAFDYCWYGSSFVNPADNSLYASDITFNPDYFGSGDYPMAWAFAYCQNECAIMLPSVSVSNSYSMFAYSNFTKILASDGASVKFKWSAIGPFRNCPNLTEIGAFDLSDALTLEGAFAYSPKLKSIHCTHFKVSFYIATSTAFEESDLVEILNNLDTVSTTQTLTMGATNLAKLTSDEILIATGKGWALN